MKKPLIIASVVAISATMLFSGTSAQAVDCGAGQIFVNSADALLVYNADGTMASGVPLSVGYGDIALSLDHTTVYGVQNDIEVAGDTIDIIDASTGIVTGSITITGDAAGVGGWVGAAILPSGELVIGSANNANAYKVDVTSGASTMWSDMSLADASITNTAGDFSRLPDGDEVALANDGSGESALLRIAADGTATMVGHVPDAWGAGRVGSNIIIAGSDGVAYSLAIGDIPATAGTSTLTTTQAFDTGAAESMWGAAGTQDGETAACDAPAAAETPAADLAHTGLNVDALAPLAALMLLAGAVAATVGIRRRKVGTNA